MEPSSGRVKGGGKHPQEGMRKKMNNHLDHFAERCHFHWTEACAIIWSNICYLKYKTINETSYILLFSIEFLQGSNDA